MLLPAGCFAVYMILTLMVCDGGSNDIFRFGAIAMLGISTAVICLLNIGLSRLRKRRTADGRGTPSREKGGFPIGSAVMTLLVFACVMVNSWFQYAPAYSGFLEEFMDRGTGISNIMDSKFAWLQQIEDDSFYRIDSHMTVSNTENYALLLGYRATSQYNSIVNHALMDWLLDTESIGVGAIHRLQNLDSRTALEALAGVKYYFTKTGEAQHVPYGFALVEELSDDQYAIYQNMHPLSLGYTYDTCMREETYLQLDAAQRESVLMTAAVVDEIPEDMQESPASEKDDFGIVTERAELPDAGTDVTRTETGYIVDQSHGTINISYRRKSGYTCYMRLTGLDTGKSYAFVDIDTSDLHTRLTVRGTGKLYSLNRTDYMVNLGYDETDRPDSVAVSFRETGAYTLEGAELIYLPMAKYEEAVSARNEERLDNAVLDLNTVTGTAEITGTKLMVFSIPWSEGWTVTVDGEKQELLQANTAWMGTVLTEGLHEIQLTYKTPGAQEGGIITLLSWLFWICAGVHGWHMKNRKI